MPETTLLDCSALQSTDLDLACQQTTNQLVLQNCHAQVLANLHQVINQADYALPSTLVLLPQNEPHFLEMLLFFLDNIKHLQAWKPFSVHIQRPNENAEIHTHGTRIAQVLQQQQVFRQLEYPLPPETSQLVEDLNKQVQAQLKAQLHIPDLEEDLLTISDDLVDLKLPNADALNIRVDPKTLQLLDSLNETVTLLYQSIYRQTNQRETSDKPTPNSSQNRPQASLA